MRLGLRTGLIVVLLAAAGTAGCGGGGGGATAASANGNATGRGRSYPASFDRIVADAESSKGVWTGPTSSPPVKKGQFVFSIPCSEATAGCATTNRGVKEAAKVLGWRFMTIDPEGDPNKQNDAVEQAIRLHANVIVLHAIDPKIVSVPLARARKSGIVVICVTCGHENDPITPTGIQHDVTYWPERQGRVMGALLAVASKGSAQIGMITDPEFPTVQRRYDGTLAALKQCSGCKVDATLKFSQTEIGTSLGAKSQAFLRSHPDDGYVWLPFDAAAAPIISTAMQTGSANAKFVSFNGDPQNVDFVRKGQELATMGTALDWMGWAALDDANRLLNGKPALKDDGVPSRLIVRSNAARYANGGFQGDIDYASKFKELWTTGKTSAGS